MSTTTTNLGLFKYNTSTDANVAFNIEQALNYNWDIIDSAIEHVDGLPDQTDKAGYILTTNGSEASWGETTSIVTVIESYTNNMDWYRIYSDGWCEQGGYVTISATSTTIPFLKQMRDSNYCILTQGKTSAYTTSNTINIQSLSKTVSSMTIGCATTTINVYWKICGYLADGEY